MLWQEGAWHTNPDGQRITKNMTFDRQQSQVCENCVRIMLLCNNRNMDFFVFVFFFPGALTLYEDYTDLNATWDY